MKFLILLTVVFLFNPLSVDAADDRDKINQVMQCFFKWDLTGGAETAQQCVSQKVLYHRVDANGAHITYTPGLDGEGKGKDAHEHNVIDIDIYGNMAVVTALLRYNPQSPNNTYMKTFVLYRVTEGWRVTNVFWGPVTTDK